MRYMLFIFLFLLSQFACADSASFNCAKAATPTEQHICADPKLRLLDKAIARRYSALMNYLPIEQKAALKQQQLNWLQTRVYQANKSDDFLTNMQNQNAKLTDQITQIILSELALIPSQPKKVAELLQQFPTALAQSWLAFIYAGNYLPASNRINEILAKNAENIKIADDPALIQAYNAKPDSKNLMAAIFIDLRMAYDAETHSSPLTYPCFVKQQYPNVYDNLISYWGSTRDAQAPVDDCAINDPYSALPAYAKFSDLLKKMDAEQGNQDMQNLLPGDPNANDPAYVYGSIRYSLENAVLSDEHDTHHFLINANIDQLMQLNPQNAQSYLVKFSQNKKLRSQFADFLTVQKQFQQQVAQLVMQKFKVNSTEANTIAGKIIASLIEANCSQLAFEVLYQRSNEQNQ